MDINNVLIGFGSFLSYLNVALIYCKIADKKCRIKPLLIIILIVLAAINSLVIPLLPLFIKPIYNIVCFGLSIYMISKINIKKVIYYVFVIWFVGILIDIIYMSVFSLLFENFFSHHPYIGLLITSITLQLILYLFFSIRPIRKLSRKMIDKLMMIKSIIWMFLLIIFIVILFGVFIFTKMTSFKTTILLVFLLVIAIFIIFLMIKILYLERTYKLTIENLLDNNKYYIEENNKDRVFKHNVVHRLNSIKSLGEKKVNKLVDDLIKEYNLGGTPDRNINNLPNGINGIISRSIYSKNIKNLNIAVNNYLESDLFSVLTPRKYNKLCETIGVCLDNALTACAKTKDKILQIVIFEDKNNIVIKIINTFESSLEVDKLGSLYYSTKKDGHGIGLYSLLGKKDVVVKTSIINNLFENQITIKKIKSL